MELKDKVVLITGSSSGIGKTTALRFAKEGCKVIINYNVNEQGAEETLKELKDINENCISIQADVSDPKEVGRMFEEIIKKFNTFDILINNAGKSIDLVDFIKADKTHIQSFFDVNVIGTMLCSQEALKIFNKNGQGKILNNSSIKGWEHGGGGVVYAATKAAVNSFTRTLAKSVTPPITVNAVGPGYVKTRSYEGMTRDKMEKYLNSTILKRWVTEEEIADAFVFLAKNDAMTGQVIYVDAGFTLK